MVVIITIMNQFITTMVDMAADTAHQLAQFAQLIDVAADHQQIAALQPQK